jgi:phage host-nuclease inhibitor protein Gam
MPVTLTPMAGSWKINDWTNADAALARLGQLRRQVSALALTRDEIIQQAKEQYNRQAAPVLEQLEQGEETLQRFVLSNQADLEGRSRKLTHGRLGFLLAHKLSIRNVKKALAWLLEAGKVKYLRVEHELNKEALAEAPDDVLRAIGAKVKTRDLFWYEVDGERYTVKD